MAYNITFHYKNGKDEKKELIINANSEETFEKIMNKFFSQTNTIPTKNTKKISVIYIFKVLNSDDYLQRTVKKIFKLNLNPNVSVLDIDSIIGD